MTTGQKWWEVLGSPVAVTRLFARPPELFGIDLVAVRCLHADEDALEIEFDLPRFPDLPPSSWPAGSDAARAVLRLTGLRDVSLSGWRPTADLVVAADAPGVRMLLAGKGLRLEAKAARIDLASVAGRVRERPRRMFGDPTDFALEVEPEPPPDRTNWSAMRAWSQGHPIGDLEQSDAMSNVARDLHGAMHESPGPSDDDRLYAALPPAEAIALLERHVWGCDGDPEQAQRLADRHLFLIGSGCSQFDGHRAFRVRLPDGRVRFLHRTLGGQVRAAESSLVGFRDAVQAYLRWYESRCDQTGEIPKYPRLTASLVR